MKSIFRFEFCRLKSSFFSYSFLLLSLGEMLIYIIDENAVKTGYTVILLTGDIVGVIMPFLGLLSGFLVIQLFDVGTMSELIWSGISRIKVLIAEYLVVYILSVVSLIIAIAGCTVFVTVTRDGIGIECGSVLTEYVIRALGVILIYSLFYLSFVFIGVAIMSSVIICPVLFIGGYIFDMIMVVLVNKMNWAMEIIPVKAIGVAMYNDTSSVHAIADLGGVFGAGIIMFCASYVIFRKKEIR